MGGPLELNRAVPADASRCSPSRTPSIPGSGTTGSSITKGEILRYDNVHENDDLGRHHRHVRCGEDSEIPFQNVTAHATRFLQEVAHFTDLEDTDND